MAKENEKEKRNREECRKRMHSSVKRAHGKMRAHRVHAVFAVCFFAIIIVCIAITTGIRRLVIMSGIHRSVIFGSAFATYALLCLCVILAYISNALLIRQIFKPLTEISKASKKIAEGQYDIQINTTSMVLEVENTIRNFNKMAKELNSVEMLRNDFIANVSHEFKTPLNSVKGYATLLMDDTFSKEEKEEYIRKLLFNVEKLNELTGNILLISKLDSQTFVHNKEAYRLDEQLRETIVLLEPKWSAKQLELDLELDEIDYYGARSLMSQVWTNLINNAIKFSDVSGRITVKLYKKDGELSVIVSDNGIGMDEETQKHIFDKFYQGDTSRKSQGNGLGLALCKKILEQCGGNIYVSSERKVGTTFLVKLPEKPEQGMEE